MIVRGSIIIIKDGTINRPECYGQPHIVVSYAEAINGMPYVNACGGHMYSVLCKDGISKCFSWEDEVTVILPKTRLSCDGT